MKPYYVKAIKAIDKHADVAGPSGYAAAMLLCSAKHGLKIGIPAIIHRTGVPSRQGQRIAERLRANRIWWRGKVYHGGWTDPKSGGIAFWMDALVGAGLMKRAEKGKAA